MGNPSDIHPEEEDIFTLSALDMLSHAEKYGVKALRKNLTIPAYLNTFAKANGINFFNVLHGALTALMQAHTTRKQYR